MSGTFNEFFEKPKACSCSFVSGLSCPAGATWSLQKHNFGTTLECQWLRRFCQPANHLQQHQSTPSDGSRAQATLNNRVSKHEVKVWLVSTVLLALGPRCSKDFGYCTRSNLQNGLFKRKRKRGFWNGRSCNPVLVLIWIKPSVCVDQNWDSFDPNIPKIDPKISGLSWFFWTTGPCRYYNYTI